LEQIREYEVHDWRFKRLASMNARLVRLWSGAAWAEGPVWFADANQLLFSDIPNDRILRFVPDVTGLEGQVSVFRQPAGNTNGHTRDREGRLVSCSHRHRRVERTEPDGRITVLAERWNGKRLNSPNDVVVKSDGTVWFTDPAYGIDTVLEGEKGEREYGGCFVFRLDPRSGGLTPVVEVMQRPNGLCFSPDERVLYVADTGISHDPQGPRHIRRFLVQEDGRLVGGEVLVSSEVGVFDGFRCDSEGRLWTSAGDGVHCYDPDGRLLGKIKVPEVVANLCFGGPRRNRLFICGTTSLYAVWTHVTGAQVP
jgi:gluconolactonase